ncbi:MAG TPA: hypothetical protein VL133_16870 [Devosia sp.]|nr:hypothetical protein [Devosia sp.]
MVFSAAGQAKTIGLIGLAALAGALAIFFFSFPRGLGLTDESLAVYLLLHPNAPMPSMDHFVLGHVLAWMPLNLIALRWLGAAAVVGSSTALSAAVLFWSGRRQAISLLGCLLAIVFGFLGSLLFFTALRPTPNYALNLVVVCNLFAALRFATDDRDSWVAAILMGALAAMAFLARVPASLFLVVFLIMFEWTAERKIFRRAFFVRASRILAAAVLILIGLVLAGLQIKLQFDLLHALTITSHSPSDLLAIDLPYAGGIGVAAILLAGGTCVLVRRFNAPRNIGIALLTTVCFAVLAALVCMKIWGFFVLAPLPDQLLDGNAALRSLGPALHVVLLAAIFCQAGLARTAPTTERTLLRLCLLLYFLCLLPFIGTNTGIWHRSTANMGPPFLAIGIILSHAIQRRRIADWVAAPVVFATALPVMAALYASLVTHPVSVAGSAAAQTQMLNHPSFLRGLWVAPPVAALQTSVERQLNDVHFDFAHEALLPGTGRLGMAVLAGADALGNGWYFAGYGGSEVWNCAVMALWLPHASARVVGIDVDSFQPETRACLKRYTFPPSRSAALGIVSVLYRRD